ncbi:MAG: DUF1566 domain-containing protein [Nitrospinae bacterium]|nr:DUF1566 domain-containing protein [Nitrospinota bacterium]
MKRIFLHPILLFAFAFYGLLFAADNPSEAAGNAKTGTLKVTAVDTNGKEAVGIDFLVSYTTAYGGWANSNSFTMKIPAGKYVVSINGTPSHYSIKSPKTGKKTVSIIAGKTTTVKFVFASTFMDNKDGTVTDTGNGLMWQQDENPPCNWYEASGTYDADYNSGSASVCGSLSLAGYSGWRLPTVDELKTLAVQVTKGPVTYTAFFPNAMPYSYWSSTLDADGLPYGLDFRSTGTEMSLGTNSSSVYVRCVRSGQ